MERMVDETDNGNINNYNLLSPYYALKLITDPEGEGGMKI